MNTINDDNCMFLIIDIQEKLVNMLSNSNIVKNAIILSKAAEILNLPVIISEQYPKGLGYTINEIKINLPNAKYVEKNSFNAMNEILIKQFILNENKKQIIIFGIETHICVLQTALALLNMNYEVFIVKSACDSRNEDDKQTALTRLTQAGAQILTTEMVIFELLKSSNHPQFKNIQALIK